MLHELIPNVYVNEIPLPGNPLKALNSYIILSENKNLIIDTGFNTSGCKKAFMQGTAELNLDLAATNLILTHMHADHTGLVDEIIKHGSDVWIGKKDGELLNFLRTGGPTLYHSINKAISLQSEDLYATGNFGFGKSSSQPLSYTALHEGDIVQVGAYALEVIDIPGHTPGHIGLYERSKKLFFCGDHILNEITPNITFYGFEQDALGIYLQSLDKVYQLEIDYVFPGHRSTIRDHRKRIDQLKAHHLERLEEITGIIHHGKMTGSQTASHMHWDLSYSNWEEFPGMQKWFASGEAMAHLEHLVFTGIARRVEEKGNTYYELR